jgi:hypothetical protein
VGLLVADGSHTRAKTNAFEMLCSENRYEASPIEAPRPPTPTMLTPKSDGSASA